MRERNILVEPQKSPIFGSIFGQRVSKVCVKFEQNMYRIKSIQIYELEQGHDAAVFKLKKFDIGHVFRHAASALV